MIVHVLTCAESPETLYGNVLVFKTLRCGFPRSKVFVWDMSPYGSEQAAAIRAAAETVDATYFSHEPKDDYVLGEHGQWIEDLIRETEEAPFVIVHPDVVFWESMEDLTFPEGTLVAGRHIPKLHEMGATMAERLHPSLLFFPDPKRLREQIAEARKDTPYFYPFRSFTYVSGMSGEKVIFDTGSSFYSRFPLSSYTFTEKELDRYDHLFQGTMLPKAKALGMSSQSLGALASWHDIAKGEDLAALRGIWREQEKAFGGKLAVRGKPAPVSLALADRISWSHYVGFVYDQTGAEIAIQVTTFFGVDSYRRHVALTEKGVRRLFFDQGNSRGADQQAIAELGSIDKNGIHLTWDFVSEETVYPHGDHGKVPRYGLDCYQSSRPRNAARVHLTENGHYRSMVGSVWRDLEDLPIAAVRGWDWLGIVFTDATKGEVMIYAPAGEPAWGARTGPEGYRALGPTDFRVEVLDSYMSETTGRIYGCLWRLSLKNDDVYLVRPILQDQEIVDDVTGPYWEGACEVIAMTGKRVGTAFYEAAGYALPDEATVGLRWTMGDIHAADMLRLLAHGSQLSDDIVDGDVAPADRGKSVVEMIDTSLRELPANPFFIQHRAILGPLISLSAFNWEISNEWQKSKSRTSRLFGFVLREALDSIIVVVALIKGGRDWARKVLREVHTYYHVLDQETFEQWEAENV